MSDELTPRSIEELFELRKQLVEKTTQLTNITGDKWRVELGYWDEGERLRVYVSKPKANTVHEALETLKRKMPKLRQAPAEKEGANEKPRHTKHRR